MSRKRKHWLDYYFDTHKCSMDQKCIELKKKRREETACQKVCNFINFLFKIQEEFIKDIKSLLRLLVMYLPVPMFWALYDQQGSRWLIQAIQMDCRIWGGYLLLPDQMQTLNAMLILAFIPLFQVFKLLKIIIF